MLCWEYVATLVHTLKIKHIRVQGSKRSEGLEVPLQARNNIFRVSWKNWAPKIFDPQIYVPCGPNPQSGNLQYSLSWCQSWEGERGIWPDGPELFRGFMPCCNRFKKWIQVVLLHRSSIKHAKQGKETHCTNFVSVMLTWQFITIITYLHIHVLGQLSPGYTSCVLTC